MADVPKSSGPYDFSELKPDVSSDADAGTSMKPKLKLPDGTVMETTTIYVNKNGGILVNGGSTLPKLGYDPKQQRLTFDGKILDEKNPANKNLMRELGWFFLRNSDNPKAKTVLKEVYHIDLEANRDESPDGLTEDLELEKHSLFPSLKGVAGRPKAGPPTKRQLLAYLCNQEGWDGMCTSPDAPCTYQKGNDSFIATPEMKKGMELLLVAKNEFAPENPELKERFGKKLLSSRTLDEIEKLARNLPSDQSEVKIYVGAEWCGGCRVKRTRMLNGSISMPDFVSWDPDQNRSEILNSLGKYGQKTIPAMITITRKPDGSLDRESVKASGY